MEWGGKLTINYRLIRFTPLVVLLSLRYSLVVVRDFNINKTLMIQTIPLPVCTIISLLAFRNWGSNYYSISSGDCQHLVIVIILYGLNAGVSHSGRQWGFGTFSNSLHFAGNFPSRQQFRFLYQHFSVRLARLPFETCFVYFFRRTSFL